MNINGTSKPISNTQTDKMAAMDGDLLTLDLCGKWQLTNKSKSYNVAASVPGSMYTTLQAAGVLKDPYYRYNDQEYRWVAWEDWTYSTTFTVSSDLVGKSAMRLVADGLDTVAQIYINDVLVGKSENQFRRYVFDVKSAVEAGVNSIRVCFESAPRYAENQAAAYPYLVPPISQPFDQCPEKYANFIRKAQCSFAWDWGPAFPTQGIWQSIRLEAFNHVTFRQVVPTPSKDESGWQLKVVGHFDVAGTAKGQFEVNIPELKVKSSSAVILTKENNTATLTLKSDNVEPWWPRGYGEPKLYDLELTFTPENGQSAVKKCVRTGFRTIELVQDKMEEGYSFYYKWNGLPIFLKGNNWIPFDSFPERVTKNKIRELLEDAAAANMNTARIWGGGIYQVEEFYDLADEMGMIVWQDIMFACSMYPSNQEFLDNVRAELTYQVQRLSRHPSIICWTGNNENEGAIVDNWYRTSDDFDKYANDYRSLYVDTVRDEVLKQDPSRPFQVSSPSNGPITADNNWISRDPKPGSSVAGTIHFYDYSADALDHHIYPRPRFAAEYGLQSWPSFHTIKKISEPADWNCNSGFARHRQRNIWAQIGIDVNLRRHFQLPNSGNAERDFKDYIYLTQIQQSLMYKLQTEVYRRGQGDPKVKTMGAIYWQHNDIWQGPTWATIDFDGNWKMAHYYARQFFSDVAVSSYIEEGEVIMYGISDLTSPLDDLVLSVRVMTWQQFEPLDKIEVSCNMPSQNAVKLHTLSIDEVVSKSGKNREEIFLLCQLRRKNNEAISPESTQFLVPTKDIRGMQKSNVKIYDISTISPTELRVTLSTDAVAAFVWLEAPGIRGRFSDNGFLMSERTAVVSFYAREVSGDGGVTAAQLRACLEVRALGDMYEE